MAEHDARGTKAHHLGRLHILLFLLRQYRGAHGTGVLRPLGDTDDHHQHQDGELRVELGTKRRLEDGGDDDRHHHGGERQLHVGKAHQQAVDAATEVASQQADDDAQHQLQPHREQTYGERDAGAIEDGAPDVATLVVCTEPEALLTPYQPGGRQFGIHQIEAGLVIDVVRGEPGRQHGGQHEHHEHRKAEHGYLVPQEVVDDVGIFESSPTAWACSYCIAHVLPLSGQVDGRVDQPVEQVDQGIGHHENEPDEDDVGGDEGRIDPVDRLEEQKAGPRPLEHALGQYGVGHHGTDLHAANGNDRQHGVLQGVLIVDLVVVQPLGAGELDVLGGELLQHLGAHQPDEQRQHDGGERYAGQDQMLDAVPSEEARLPAQQIVGLAAAIGRQPAQLDGEEVHQHDGGQEHRDRDADAAPRHDDLGRYAVRADRRVDPKRNGDHHDDQRSAKHQLKSSHQLVEDDLEGWSLEEVGSTQIPVYRVLQEAAVFDEERIVEAHLLAQFVALGFGDGLSHQLAQRIPQIVLDGEGDQADDEHHYHGLIEPFQQECKHACPSTWPVSWHRLLLAGGVAG